jgi:hypothetical protein
MAVREEASLDLERLDNIIRTSPQAERPDSTCTHFPTSFDVINHAEKLDQGRHDSTCTTFPSNFSFANPAGEQISRRRTRIYWIRRSTLTFGLNSEI